MKHKLRAKSALGDGHDEVKDYFSHNTCASFMGKELIRYAESQAVFTFAIFGPQRNGHFDSCLLLRVLSWNTSMAIGSQWDSRIQEGSEGYLRRD